MGKSGDERKGFAGFEAMVSNIDEELADIRKASAARPAQPSARNVAPAPTAATAPSKPDQPQQQRTIYSPPDKKSGGAAKVWGWIIGIVVLIAIVNAANKSPQPSTAYTPSSPSYSPPAPSTSGSSYVAPVSNSLEQVPAVGTGRAFSNNEIRYCLSEDIRIESMRSTVNNYASYEVDQFNAVVSDYNSRCSNFRYRKGTLESVRSEVELNRLSLSAEGRNKVLAWRQQDSRNQAAARYAPVPSPVPIYAPPTPPAPTYVPSPPTPRFPELNIDQAEINRMQEEGRRYMQGYQAAQRVCGQIPGNVAQIDAWMACMSSQGY